MTKIVVAAVTAFSIAAATVAPVGGAHAAPLSAFSPVAEAEMSQVTEVGQRHRRHRRHRHHRRVHRDRAAGAAILGLGAFALGAAIASQHQRPCVIERVRVWDPYLRAYIIREQRVC